MQNVLVVDDEKTLRMIIVGRLEDFKDRLSVFTASNGKEAIKVLASNEIDLVITDLNMPDMDGIELIAYMNGKFPSVPTIVVSAYCTPEIQKKLKGFGALRVMDKPVNLDQLTHAVMEGLQQAHKGGSLNCVSLSSFLQIIEMEEKSCQIDVHANGQQRGNFVIVQGVLHDAVCGKLKGEAAAHEMISWDGPQLFIKDLPKNAPEKHIEKGLMSVVMDGLRKKDEAEEEKETSGAAGKEKPAATAKPADNPGHGKQPPDQPGTVKVIKADPEDPGPIFGPDDDTFTSELDNVLDILNEDPEVVELKKGASPPKEPPDVNIEPLLVPAEIADAARSDRSVAEVVSALIQKTAAAAPVDVAILLTPVEAREDALRISSLIYSDQRIVDTSTIMPLSNTLIGQVMERQVPAVLNLADLKPESVEQKLLERMKMKTCLLVPLPADGYSPVLLILAAGEEGRFSDCGPVLEWVTDGLSLALERGQLHRELVRQRLTAGVVQHIDQTVLSGAIAVDPLLKHVMDQIRDIFQVEAGSLLLKEKEQLKTAMAFNTTVGKVKQFQLKIGQGIAGTVAAKAKPMIVNDAQKSSFFSPEIDKQTGFTTRSALCVPLVALKKVIGVLEILNKSQQDFTKEDQTLLLTIASALSVALIVKRSQSGR